MTVENKKIELEKTSKEYSYWGGVDRKSVGRERVF